MKKLLLVLALCIAGTAFAGGTTKTVCNPAKDKKGNVIKNQDGSTKQVCKKIKVHKKVNGNKVPAPAKKKK